MILYSSLPPISKYYYYQKKKRVKMVSNSESSSNNNNSSRNDNNPIMIDYNDLLLLPSSSSSSSSSSPSSSQHIPNPKLHSLLNKAFGNSSSTTTSSLGLILIKNIPNFTNLKSSFLPLAHDLITIPSTYLNNKLTDSKSLYNAGWSHGKEKLKNDEPDYSKGSFYFNPIVDVPGTEEERTLYPLSYPINIWPDKDLLPGLEKYGKEMGRLMKDVVSLLAYHIDDYIRLYSGIHGCDVSIGNEMKNTEKVKGRLLYYFPQEVKNDTNKDDNDNNDTDEYDSWIGWHNDSGFLTALSGDIYVDHDTGEIIPKDEIDPNAGLYIQDRNGTIQHITIPDDCMAIQIGECLQIISGGSVVATPHCVRGADPNYCYGNGVENQKKRKVARISFPCFVDTIPSFSLKVPIGRSSEDVLKSGVVGCAKVPPLEDR